MRASNILLLLCSLCLSDIASADIAYDNLYHATYQGTLLTKSEAAQGVRLEPGQGLQINGLGIRISNGTWDVDNTGTLRLAVYADLAGSPGEMLTSTIIPFEMPRQTEAVRTVDFSPVKAPTSDVWVGWYFQVAEDTLGTGVTTGGFPLIGSTNNQLALRSNGTGEWSAPSDWFRDPFQIMVLTVPSPATPLCASLGLASLATRRRRA